MSITACILLIPLIGAILFICYLSPLGDYKHFFKIGMGIIIAVCIVVLTIAIILTCQSGKVINTYDIIPINGSYYMVSNTKDNKVKVMFKDNNDDIQFIYINKSESRENIDSDEKPYVAEIKYEWNIFYHTEYKCYINIP